MNRKGFIAIPLIVFLTIVLLFTIIFGISFTISKGLVIQKTITVQQDMYAMLNSLEASKAYLDTAIKYSLYQAAYDYGLEEKHDSNPDNIIVKISEKAKEKLNGYTKENYKFLSDKYQVQLPSYSRIDPKIYKSANIITGFTVEAVPTDTIRIALEKEGESTKLEKQAKINFNFQYPILQLMDSLTSDKLKQKADEIIKSHWPKELVKTITGCDKKSQRIETVDVLNEQLKINSGKEFKTFEDAVQLGFNGHISSKIQDIQNQLSNNLISLEISIDDPKATVQVEFCQGEPVDNCDKGGAFTYTRKCSFNYSYSGKAKISITDKTKTYPVKALEGSDSKVLFKSFIFKTTNSFSSG